MSEYLSGRGVWKVIGKTPGEGSQQNVSASSLEYWVVDGEVMGGGGGQVQGCEVLAMAEQPVSWLNPGHQSNMMWSRGVVLGRGPGTWSGGVLTVCCTHRSFSDFRAAVDCIQLQVSAAGWSLMAVFELVSVVENHLTFIAEWYLLTSSGRDHFIGFATE